MANPGDSCSNAIVLTPSPSIAPTDYLFSSTETARWFSFVATDSLMDIRITVPVIPSDTPETPVDSLFLYTGSCTGLTLIRYNGLSNGRDSLPVIQILNLTIGQTYFIKVLNTRVPGYFGLTSTNIPAPISSPGCLAACGPNLLCNGDFEIQAPAGWPTSVPGSYYQDNSPLYNATPPAAYSAGYCINSPNTRFDNGTFGIVTDFTDIYKIGTYMAFNFANNTAQNGSFFMGVDCASPSCIPCSLTNPLATLYTPLYTSIPWDQTVTGLIPNATYTFSCWLEDLDGAGDASGAIVSINMDGASYFLNTISGFSGWSPWKNVCFSWTAPNIINPSVDIQITGQSWWSNVGADFGIDNVSFALAAIPPITVTPSTQICKGSCVPLAASGASSYTWSPATGLSCTNCPNPTACPTVTTTYTVTGSVDGCTATASVTITVDAPAVTIIGPVGCLSNPTLISASAFNGTGPYSYLWSTGATTTSITIPAPASITIYTVTITDADGCTATASYFAEGPPSVSISPNPLNFCNGSGVANLSIATNAPGGNYSWSPAIGVSPASNPLPSPASYLFPTTFTATGTYTVTVNDGIGCSATASITVNDGDPVPPILGNQTICYGSTVSVGYPPSCHLCPPYPYTIVWSSSPAGTFSCNTCLNPTFTPASGPGIYTLTAIVTNTFSGCTTTYTITITVNSTPVISITGPDLACDAGPFYYCPTVTLGTGTPPYTYSWNVTGAVGTTTAGGPCTPNGIRVAWGATLPINGGDVILTVTDANGCSATDTLVVRGCCPPTNSGELNDATLSALNPALLPTGMTYDPSSHTYTIDCSAVHIPYFALNGILAVDMPLVIKHADIHMGTNAKIVIVPGSPYQGSLLIDCSQLHACDQMWDGIYLNNPQVNPTLTVTNSVIEDAENAIVANTTSSYYNITSSLLNNNWKGIIIDYWTTNFSGTMTGSEISSDNINLAIEPGVPTSTPPFTCNVTFPPAYPTVAYSAITTPAVLIAPHAGHRSLMGIEVAYNSNLAANVPIGNATFNTYQDMDYGIYARQTNLSVDYDKFYSMNNSAIQNSTTPTCIYANGDNRGRYNMNVGLNSACTFTDFYTGIWVRDSMSADIKNNTLTSIPGANDPIGINLWDNLKTLHPITASYNHINTTYIGINCFDNLNSSVTMDHNNITGDPFWHTSYGIDINESTPPISATHYDIENNAINTVSSGIYALNLSGDRIDFNTINLTGQGLSGRNEGIYLGNSNNSKVINNTITIKGAPFIVAPDGIRLEHPGYLGGGSNTVACNNITALTANKLYDITFTGPQTPNTIVDLNTMKINNAGNIGIYLYTAGKIGNQGANAPGKSTANLWIPENVQRTTDAEGGLGCGGDRFFIQPVANGNPTVNFATGPALPEVFTSTGNGDANAPCPWLRVGGGHKVLDSATAMSIINDSASFSEFPQTSQWFDKLTAYTYLTETDSSLISIPAIRNFRDSARLSNMGKLIRINRLLADSNGVSYMDLVRAKHLNTSLLSPDTAERIYQRVYKVLIDMDYDSTNFPDSAQQVELKYIAPLCPSEFGGGVYIARAMLSQGG